MDRVRKLSFEILEKHKSEFGEDFAGNKQILNDLSIIRSKGLKNKIAGYITKMVKNEIRSLKAQEEQEQAQAREEEKERQANAHRMARSETSVVNNYDENSDVVVTRDGESNKDTGLAVNDSSVALDTVGDENTQKSVGDKLDNNDNDGGKQPLDSHAQNTTNHNNDNTDDKPASF